MVRLSAAGFLMFVLVGCTGLIDGSSGNSGDDDDGSQAMASAMQKWTGEAYPLLSAQCSACHAGQRQGIGFLIGADPTAVRDTLLKYDPPVINLDTVSISRIVTKGLHDGPQLSTSQVSTVLDWLQAEHQAASASANNSATLIASTAMLVQTCTADTPEGGCPVNHIPLSSLANATAGVDGAEITFSATALSSGLYLTDMKVNGGTTGVYMEHLLFVSKQKSGLFPDQIDRYFSTKLNVAANATVALGGGTEQFGGFAATDMVQVDFKVLSPFKPDTSTPTNTGCRVLAKFKTNAVPALTQGQGGQQACVACHAGTANPNAKASMDLTGITAADDATLQTACNQVRTRVNLTTTDQSAIYVAPDPGSATNHPIKIPAATFTTYKSGLDVWVQAEKTAP